MILIRTGDCQAGTETALANLDAIGESSFAYARAGVGFVDGATTILVGLGNWTNSYTHPCEVYVYTYDIATDSYSSLTRTLIDILPTLTYPGSQPGQILYDGDVSSFVTRFAEGSPNIVAMYDLTGASIKSLTWGGAFPGNVVVARRGTNTIMGNSDGTPAALRRWATTGGSSTLTSPSTARKWQILHIHKDETYLYGLLDGGATIYQYDMATLTEQTSFAVPTGGAVIGRLFSHTNNPNIWYASTFNATTKRVYEQVQGAWVLRHTITGSFNVDSLHNYIDFEGSTLYDFYNESDPSQQAWKIDPLGCNG